MVSVQLKRVFLFIAEASKGLERSHSFSQEVAYIALRGLGAASDASK